MKEKIFLLLVFAALLVDARSNRVERQSPISMGMKMLEDFRGGVQRTFEGLMGSIMGRPRRIRGRNPHAPNAPHRISPNSPHHLPPNSPHFRNPHHQHLTIVHQEAPSPVFKTTTSSSFSVIHGNHGHTESPIQNEIFQPDHFGVNSINLHKQNHGKRQTNQHENNFIQHRATDVENVHASFLGSPLIEDIPITVDGWVALPPPHLKKKSENRPVSSVELNHKIEVDLKQHKQTSKSRNPQISLHTPPRSGNTNNIVIPSEVKVLTASKPKHIYHSIYSDVTLSNTPKQLIQGFSDKRRPVRHDGNAKNIPSTLYKEDISGPLLANNQLNTRSNNLKIKKRINLARNTNRINQIQPGKLISSGMKMELSPDVNKEMKVAGYEFGYGVTDDNSGNKFYHAEKKQDGMTQGSYKVQLPDGRIQTVDYAADHRGYRPKISFEGKAQYPIQHQQRYKKET